MSAREEDAQLDTVQHPQLLRRKLLADNGMTKEYLKEHCRQNDLYMTPGLNDVLYLHHKGFVQIQALEEYTGLKSLWLENNSIKKIENISLEELEQCPSISILDLSDNGLGDPSSLIVLSQMADLKVLTLGGNPIVGRTREYRRHMIQMCPKLTYLDQRPVRDKDRECVQAWAKGGLEAEKELKDKWAKEEQERLHQDVMELMKRRDANLAKRGISSETSEQIRAEEDRGKELLEQYKEELLRKRQQEENWTEEEYKRQLLERSRLDGLSSSIQMCLAGGGVEMAEAEARKDYADLKRQTSGGDTQVLDVTFTKNEVEDEEDEEKKAVSDEQFLEGLKQFAREHIPESEGERQLTGITANSMVGVVEPPTISVEQAAADDDEEEAPAAPRKRKVTIEAPPGHVDSDAESGLCRKGSSVSDYEVFGALVDQENEDETLLSPTMKESPSNLAICEMLLARKDSSSSGSGSGRESPSRRSLSKLKESSSNYDVFREATKQTLVDEDDNESNDSSLDREIFRTLTEEFPDSTDEDEQQIEKDSKKRPMLGAHGRAFVSFSDGDHLKIFNKQLATRSPLLGCGGQRLLGHPHMRSVDVQRAVQRGSSLGEEEECSGSMRQQRPLKGFPHHYTIDIDTETQRLSRSEYLEVSEEPRGLEVILLHDELRGAVDSGDEQPQAPRKAFLVEEID